MAATLCPLPLLGSRVGPSLVGVRGATPGIPGLSHEAGFTYLGTATFGTVLVDETLTPTKIPKPNPNGGVPEKVTG
eukprot:867781-Heterocapsa_arctica.AAC.1